jgi:hypothetical protein
MELWYDKLFLFSLDEYNQLPDGIELTSISGRTVIKGKDLIDTDDRYGCTAWGVFDPMNHPLRELFMTFMLSKE